MAKFSRRSRRADDRTDDEAVEQPQEFESFAEQERFLAEAGIHQGAYETKLDGREGLRIFDTAGLAVGDVIKACPSREPSEVGDYEIVSIDSFDGVGFAMPTAMLEDGRETRKARRARRRRAKRR